MKNSIITTMENIDAIIDKCFDEWNIHFTIGEEKFSTLCLNNTITLFARDGGLQLARYKITDNNVDELKQKIKEDIDLCVRGYKRCSDCGKIIPMDCCNSYFAGTYCDECWNTKWKKIAQEETYN